MRLGPFSLAAMPPVAHAFDCRAEEPCTDHRSCFCVTTKSVRPTDLSLSCGAAPVPQRQSGAPLAATNVKTAGCVCKRRDAVRLGRKEGLQPRASERPADSCSEKLGSSLPTLPSTQRPRTTSMPARRSSVLARESFPTLSTSIVLSSVTTCEAFATESLGSPVVLVESSTLPGASAQARLLVSGTQTTVAILLRFSASPCTTTTGLRNPGSDPLGTPSSAHHTSPCEITTPLSPEYAEQRFGQTGRFVRRCDRTLD